MSDFFSTWDAVSLLEKKRQNLNFAYTLHHIVVTKNPLGCAAAYNAITHPQCFILVNLDHSVTKQATTI